MGKRAGASSGSYMTPYHSKTGKKSGVTAFRIGEEYIKVKFEHSEKIYTYTYDSEDRSTIEEMKSLALAQKGLSTFISKHDPRYV